VSYEPRHLDWPGLVNARDLGGLPAEGGAIRSGALIRTESLTELTADGVHTVRAASVSRVIDLRRPAESQRAHPFSDDPAYVNVPVEDPADDKDQTSMLALYLAMLDTRPDLFASAVGSIADAPPGAVLVHCAAGKDRTGLVVALALASVGVAPEAIAADYALTQGRTAERLEAWLADLEEERRDEIRAWQATPPETMLAVLGHLEDRHGGVNAYLRGGGVTTDQLAALRERLVDAD